MDVGEVLKWLAGLALSALFAVVTFFEKRNLKRMDDFDERLRGGVSVELLNDTVGLLRGEIQALDASKSEWLQRLCDRVERQTDALTDATKEHNRQMQEILKLVLTRPDKHD